MYMYLLKSQDYRNILKRLKLLKSVIPFRLLNTHSVQHTGTNIQWTQNNKITNLKHSKERETTTELSAQNMTIQNP